MTVIAWDGTTMAADKRATLGTLIRTITKIFKINGCLVGCSGESSHCEDALQWFREGASPDKFPAHLRDKDAWGSMLVVKASGDILLYERSGNPTRYSPQNFAIGCGRDYAMAAMHLGYPSVRGVEVAVALDCGCGNGVDLLKFD